MKSVKVAPTAAGLALSITASNVTVEDVGFEAKDGVAAGDSSIAVFASNAQNVLFRRVIVSAGKGQSAVAATNGNNYVPATAPTGLAPTGVTGGVASANTCTNGNTSGGGAGGNGTAGQTQGGSGNWNPAGTTSVGIDGVGGMGGNLSCASNPDPGANGAAKAVASGLSLRADGLRQADRLAAREIRGKAAAVVVEKRRGPARVGAAVAQAATRRVDFHSFRRAFNTALAEAGVNVQTAMHLAAHSDAKVHSLYVMKSDGMKQIPLSAVPQINPDSLGIRLLSVTKGYRLDPKSSLKQARPAGLEPATRGLEGRCSIHLSYGRV